MSVEANSTLDFSCIAQWPHEIEYWLRKHALAMPGESFGVEGGQKTGGYAMYSIPTYLPGYMPYDMLLTSDYILCMCIYLRCVSNSALSL